MVKIWLARERPKPIRVGPAYELPLSTCVEVLGLTADHFLSSLQCTLRLGDQTARRSGITDYP